MQDFNILELNKLSNDALLDQTQELVNRERRISVAVLLHLREIQTRRLFAVCGYSSLFEFCVKELKYPEASAHRRISSMRLLNEIPEIEKSMNEGKLNVTTISQVQSFTKVVKLNIAEKREVLKSIECKSKLETEKTLNKLLFDKLGEEKANEVLASSIQRQSTKQVVPGFSEIKFIANSELEKKLTRIKALHFHKLKNSTSFSELVEMMADFVLDKTDPERIEQRKAKTPPAEVKTEAEMETKTEPPKSTRYISHKIRRELFIKSRGQCNYVDPKTKRRCAETRGLQVDHVIPFAKGGSSEPSNLRLLCMAHNQLVAMQAFGADKITQYFTC